MPRLPRHYLSMLFGIASLIVSPLALSQNGTPLMIIINDTGSADQAWVVRDDDTKQAIKNTCIAKLRDAGLMISWVSWSTINGYRSAGSKTCGKIGREVSKSTRPPMLLVKRIGQADGRIMYSNNKTNRIDASCRQQLEADGIIRITAKAKHIRKLVQARERTCAEVTTKINAQNNAPSAGLGGYPAIPRFSENCLGMNDGHVHSWDGGSLTTDAFKSARGPIHQYSGQPSQMDADRWPVGNDPAYFAIAEGNKHDLNLMNPWVLLPYDQTGVWREGPDGNVWKLDGAKYLSKYNYGGVIGHVFELQKGANNFTLSPGAIPASPKNRWHLVPMWAAPAYAKAMKAENFRYIFDTDKYARDLDFPLLHTQTKKQMKKFCRIRFMLGDGVNSLEFSGRASDRTKPSHPTFSTVGGDGIPYEWEAWIANHLNINLWHVDHVKTWDAWSAGDPYLWQAATYFKDNLRGNLIREYGNEIWNFAYPFAAQTEWVWDNGPYPEASRGDWQWVNYNYGKRVWDTAGVWAQAYASRRDDLDLTVGVHSALAPDAQIGRFNSPYGQSWGDRIDSVAGTFYFGESIVRNDNLYRHIVREGVSAVVRHHQVNLNLVEARLNWAMNLYRPYAKKWHLYEGGSHMNMIEYDRTNADDKIVYKAIKAYFDSPDYTDALNEFAAWWKSHWASGEWMWFHLTGEESAEMPWGYYHSTGDPTPVYDGSANFINNY